MRKYRIRGSRPHCWLPTFILGSLGALAALHNPSPAFAGSALDPEGAGSPTPEVQRQAVTDLRNAGTAMYYWYRDEMKPKSHAKDAKAEAEPTQVDVSKIPLISYQDLSKLLVPKYLAKLPETDPWGHPYEYRLNTQDPNAEVVMAGRTAGADGHFAGDVYQIGRFQPGDLDQDVVWVDGYFARWPQNPGK